MDCSDFIIALLITYLLFSVIIEPNFERADHLFTIAKILKIFSCHS